MNRFSQILPVFRILTTGDIILIVVLVLFALSSTVVLSISQETGSSVQIFVDNKLTYEYNLNEDNDVDIVTMYGEMKIKISGKKVWVTESSCTVKICMSMGKISHSGQTIVCVPNHVLIQVRGQEKEQRIDAVTE